MTETERGRPGPDAGVLGIGLCGYGSIGRVHTKCYRELPLLYPGRLPEIRLQAVCTSREETAQAAARQGGFEAWFSEPERLLEDGKVTVVDCCLPNHLHRRLLLQAVAAGKHVYCEKPLALNAAEAREIAAAARRAGVHLGMTFNYRFIPAVMRAKQLVAAGQVGELYSFRAEYLHTGYQDPDRPMSWRLQREASGGGALMDLGAHLIDLLRHLAGELSTVRALTHTYVRERLSSPGARQRVGVEVEDAAWLQVKLQNGALGTVEASRFATGRLDDLSVALYGSRGALQFSLGDANWLYWYDATRPGGHLGGERGWTRLETVQHYPDADIPPARCILGWTRTHAANQYAFLKALAEGKPPEPGLTDGLRCQLALEAAYRSAREDRWVEVEKE
jgi:predicted dehydrogenase